MLKFMGFFKGAIMTNLSNINYQVHRILWPTNLSPETTQALVYAISLANDFQAKLYLCYCAEEPLPAGGQRVKDYLAELMEKNQTHLEKKIEWETIITEGNVAETVTEIAQNHKIDLIVMYAKRHPYTAALFGSNAESICRSAPCPILITHPGEQALVNPDSKQIDIRKILVTDNFSKYSVFSLAYALTLAKTYKCELHLLHVVEDSHTDLQEAKKHLKEAFSAIDIEPDQVKYAVVSGKAYEKINEYIESHKIDLVCLATRESSYSPSVFSTTNSLLFGSTTDKLLRKSSCPILVVRPFETHKQEVISNKIKVLVATDGSTYAEEAVNYAANWLWPANTELRVVTVIEPLSSLGPPVTHYKLASELMEASENLVAEAAKKLQKTNLPVSHHVRGGFAADEIINEAKEWGANLIIVGTHGRRGISRFLLGSIAEKVTNNAHCSVIVVKIPSHTIMQDKPNKEVKEVKETLTS